MVYFPEKSRQFVDKGKVRVYSAQLIYPESEHFLAFNKKIIQPGQTEILNDRRKNTFKAIVLLNDKLELTLKQANPQVIDSCVVLLYLPKGENKASLKNTCASAEAEYLEIILNSVPPAVSYTQFVDYTLKKNIPQLLMSPWGTGNSILTGQSFWLSKGLFDPNHSFFYKKHDVHNSAYLFLISGEINVGGTTLTYNDAVQLSIEEDMKLEFVKTSELLIIEMSKP